MKYNDEESKTYDVRLVCRNCNNDWIKQVEKGIYIRYEKDNNYMIKPDEKNNKQIFFKCPKCGSKDKIARLSIT